MVRVRRRRKDEPAPRAERAAPAVRPAPKRARYEAWDAQRVRALRRHMGFTQQQLSDELGTRQQTVSEWETGVYQPRGASARLLTLVAERAGFRYGESAGRRERDGDRWPGRPRRRPPGRPQGRLAGPAGRLQSGSPRPPGGRGAGRGRRAELTLKWPAILGGLAVAYVASVAMGVLLARTGLAGNLALFPFVQFLALFAGGYVAGRWAGRGSSGEGSGASGPSGFMQGVAVAIGFIVVWAAQNAILEARLVDEFGPAGAAPDEHPRASCWATSSTSPPPRSAAGSPRESGAAHHR